MKAKLEETLSITMSLREVEIVAKALEDQLRSSMKKDRLSQYVMEIINSCKTLSAEYNAEKVESYLEGALSGQGAITSMEPYLLEVYKTFGYYSLPSDTLEFFKELNDILKNRINEFLRNIKSDEITL